MSNADNTATAADDWAEFGLVQGWVIASATLVLILVVGVHMYAHHAQDKLVAEKVDGAAAPAYAAEIETREQKALSNIDAAIQKAAGQAKAATAGGN